MHNLFAITQYFDNAFCRRSSQKNTRFLWLFFLLLALPGLNACFSSSSSSNAPADTSTDTEEPAVTSVISARAITDDNTDTGTFVIDWQLPDDPAANICLASEPIYVPGNCQVYNNAVLLEDPVESPVVVNDLDPAFAYHIVVFTDPDTIDAETVARPASSPLNSTGIDWCASLDKNWLDCPVDNTALSGQDGEHGFHIEAGQTQTDAAFARIGDGPKPFDFTKLDDFGNELPFSAESWACVRDNRTGLVWEVKSSDPNHLHYSGHSYSWYSTSHSNGGVSGTADGGECTGSACDSESFVIAARNDYRCAINDWRLPSPAELASIMDYNQNEAPLWHSSAIDDDLDQPVWTLISSASDPDQSWIWGPGGLPEAKSKDETHAIRLVSSPAEPELVYDGTAGCSGMIPASTPDSHFHHEPDQATSLHVQTGLEWSRCALGQQWDDESEQCTGTADTHNWQSALQAVQDGNDDEYLGHDDWRLPNIHELRSIVETRCNNPAINRHVFPQTPVNRAWSSTPSVFDPENALMTDFASGADLHRHKSNGGHVRLVRQSLELPAADYQIIAIGLGSDDIVKTDDGDNHVVPGNEISITASIYNTGNTADPGEFAMIAINTDNGNEILVSSMTYDGIQPGYYHLGGISITGTITTTGVYEILLVNQKSGENMSAGLLHVVEPDVQVIAAGLGGEHVVTLDNGDYVIADNHELEVTASIYNAGYVSGLSEFDLIAINTADNSRSVIATDSSNNLQPGYYHLGALSFIGALPGPGEYQLQVENRKTDNVYEVGMIAAVIPDIQVIAAAFDDDYVDTSAGGGHEINSGEQLRVIASIYNAGDVVAYGEFALYATKQDTGTQTHLDSTSYDGLAPGYYHLGALSFYGTLTEPGDYQITVHNLTNDSERDVGILTVL